MNFHTLTRSLLPLLALTATQLAQSPAAASQPTNGQTPTLAELAKSVQQAHRPNGAVAKLDQFVCDLELHLIDRKAEQGGQVAMSVQFMRWLPPGRKKQKSLIRYSVREAEQPIVRGRDKFGAWQLHRGEPRDLTGADFAEQDMQTFRQHTNLARQLLRFLEPGAVIRSLRNAGLVQQETLRVNRKRRTCYTIAGRLDAFPLMQEAGEDAPVQLKIFVDQKTGRLLAADATPIIDDKPASARGERILLLQMHERDGVMVPGEVQHLFREGEKLRAVSRVKLTTMDLRPKLTADDFERTLPLRKNG